MIASINPIGKEGIGKERYRVSANSGASMVISGVDMGSGGVWRGNNGDCMGSGVIWGRGLRMVGVRLMVDGCAFIGFLWKT